MRIFVTGLGGYLGHAIARASGPEHAISGSVRTRPAPAGSCAFTLDVRDAQALATALAQARPDAVIHAAYQQRGEAARAINAAGSAVVARAARDVGARLVHVSTDLVFAQAPAGRGLREDDPPAPLDPYGESKAAAERAVAAIDPGALIVRTSLIYGGAEPGPQERLALDPAASFYRDERRCPVAAPDLARALLELAGRPQLRGPLHVAGADALSRLELARLLAAAAGRDPATLAASDRPPGRAGDLTLDCSRAQALLATRLRGAREVLGGA